MIQFYPQTGEDGLFSMYIGKNMALKIQASGWPLYRRRIFFSTQLSSPVRTLEATTASSVSSAAGTFTAATDIADSNQHLHQHAVTGPSCRCHPNQRGATTRHLQQRVFTVLEMRRRPTGITKLSKCHADAVTEFLETYAVYVLMCYCIYVGECSVKFSITHGALEQADVILRSICGPSRFAPSLVQSILKIIRD